jgi:DnaJ domain
MIANVTAYSVLGLKPGADRDAVEKAYRRLIKRYHPDRAGGDGARAAEINRAYFELRGGPLQDPPQRETANLAEAIYRRRAHRTRVAHPPPRGRVWKPVVLLILVIVASTWRDRIGAFASALAGDVSVALQPAATYRAAPAPAEGPDPLESQLDKAAIKDSIRDVRRLVAADETERAADLSRECHRRMRDAPSAGQLDRCAALDFTVVALSRNDSLHDEGPFSAAAVTAREMSAARLLSDDYVLIEMRFDQVRAQVEAVVDPNAGMTASPVPTATDDQAGRTALPGRLRD